MIELHLMSQPAPGQHIALVRIKSVPRRSARSKSCRCLLGVNRAIGGPCRWSADFRNAPESRHEVGVPRPPLWAQAVSKAAVSNRSKARVIRRNLGRRLRCNPNGGGRRLSLQRTMADDER